MASDEASQTTTRDSGLTRSDPFSPLRSGSQPAITPQQGSATERSSLLYHNDTQRSRYDSIDAGESPSQQRGWARQLAYSQSLRSRAASRRNSITRRTPTFGLNSSYLDPIQPETPQRSDFLDNRTWYDQFTSTDWIRDAIADAVRVKELRARRDWRGRVQSFFDGGQGWILVAIIGCLTASVAYVIDVTEAIIFDYKTGYCTSKWWYNRRKCCDGANICNAWSRWSAILQVHDSNSIWLDWAAFMSWVVSLSVLACLVTLATRTNISSHVTLSTLDENLGADPYHNHTSKSNEGESDARDTLQAYVTISRNSGKVFYPAAGSGVAEVKVILSGFVLHGYLGARTLLCKSIGLILSVASGLSIGKEGPYVHIAACIGNITARVFSKYRRNDAKRREVLSASAAAGVAVAFGAPIGGVLFSLEEVSYYFPPKTLFRTFFCCIVAALSLKFLNPYGTNKIVLFEVRYINDWYLFEIGIFALLGIIGGTLGALFIKASRLWATTFRRIKIIRTSPMTEVLLVAVVTGLISFWNRYTRLPVAELLYELAAPCNAFSDTGTGLCPTEDHIPEVIRYLLWAFAIKAILTIVTFGVKVPAGIYVPSMVVGGLLGRIVGHTVQYTIMKHPDVATFVGCPADGNPESCVVPGVYALIAAGATMCGVTRLSVTLAIILFELTGSLEHVLPFSLGVLIAKWTADAIEPSSIYDLLTDMNSYPYLDSKIHPVFTTELADITSAPRKTDYIDISASPWVSATNLRRKLQHLHMSGELDGGFPIVQNDILKGFLPAPDLEFALDRLEHGALDCYLDPHHPCADSSPSDHERWDGSDVSHDQEGDAAFVQEEGRPRPSSGQELTDLTAYIDPAPVALDICSPMDLVFECFVKLGLRYVCVLQEGQYAGMVHKKKFVKYVKDVQEHERKH